ncbi:3-ketoacyl-ACP reductase [Aeoliella sp. ICT_H6.2]|uniref:3-ketoacyl-ACP reductase n=1 Tax=Aeoliella straminimaris TaxID=2954799 RepID=A0A9X2FCJ4_9BACT|nr:3-ketoacyl-ACP reductase [Aeoliella straminimaris]MCO6046425.1 3-ketoacyl-ACP reductase [Aeoliella straminimaris]
MSNPQRRVALVTGGSRGIGLGVASALASAGFDLVINGRREASDVAEALASLESLGAATLYCQADISNLEDHANMLSQICDRFGRLDVLVNNAGVAPDVRADLLDATPESFDRLIRINLRGPYFLTQAAAKWMIEQRQVDSDFAAAIINVSSVSATEASVNRGDYCISKAGVAMATQLWAARLGEFDIPVFEVRPGIIRTDMTAGVTDKYDKMLAEGLTVEPRWGVPDDIGRAVTVLATGQLTYATGAVLPIDGGMTVRRL